MSLNIFLLLLYSIPYYIIGISFLPAKRCHGYISRNSEDGAFTTEILLPQ